MTLQLIQLHDRREDDLYKAAQAGCWESQRQLLESRRRWRANGRWERYYQAREGRVHASRTCPTLADTTAVSAVWWLSGVPVDEAALQVPLCRRCFPEVDSGRRERAAACVGSGERARCRCGSSGCREVCRHCGADVLITPSGLLRRHGTR